MFSRLAIDRLPQAEVVLLTRFVLQEKLERVGTPSPQVGTTSNRYTVLGRLAGGGMADIFLARATSEAGVERYVVLKRVIAERSSDLQLARMFLDEARLVAQLQHPNIAQVHDIGQLAGAYFFTMEYVHGEDVRHAMQRLVTLGRMMPIQHALHIAAGALAGLHHAHERVTPTGKHLGVVHRDVSPSNVMIAFEGVIKLLDFGVAKASERISEESKSGTVKGKIAYLSPEQCEGHAVDRRSDIFSLGIVLHELLTGVRLFRRDTELATMLAITQQPIPRPSEQRPEVSRALDALVMKALARDQDARFQTAAEMLEAIEEVATREQHALSATAMSRFMREIFGDRTEPWVKLHQPDDATRPITITSESFSFTDDPIAPPPEPKTRATSTASTMAEPTRNVAAARDLEAQLQAARPLEWSHGVDDVSPAVPIEPMQQFVSGPIATQTTAPPVRTPTPPPVRAPTPPPVRMPTSPPVPRPTPPSMRTPTPPPELHTPAPRAPSPSPGPPRPTPRSMRAASEPNVASPLPSSFPELGDLLKRETASVAVPPAIPTPLLTTVRATKPRPWLVIAGVAVVLGGVGAALIVPRSTEPAADPSADGSAVTISLPVVADDAASVAVLGPDAADVTAPPPAAAVAPTIASAAAARDWTTASRLCAEAGAAQLAAADLASCALAACTTKQRTFAKSYYREIPARASRTAIEHACRANGIPLTSSARPTGAAPEDPCATNPMKCRK